MNRRQLICCTQCLMPTEVAESRLELIEQPDGSFVNGYVARSFCCAEDIDFQPACTECEKMPAVTHDDACIPCAVAFYLRYPDEYRDALECGLDDYAVGQQVQRLVECRLASDGLRFIGQTDLKTARTAQCITARDAWFVGDNEASNHASVVCAALYHVMVADPRSKKDLAL